jgi:hypothetical protein
MIIIGLSLKELRGYKDGRYQEHIDLKIEVLKQTHNRIKVSCIAEDVIISFFIEIKPFR